MGHGRDSNMALPNIIQKALPLEPTYSVEVNKKITVLNNGLNILATVEGGFMKHGENGTDKQFSCHVCL
jgi:hypothetical protein